jgi:chromate transport protein ChrA
MKNGNFRELGCDGNRAELAFLIGWSLFGLLGAVILAIIVIVVSGILKIR